MLARIPELARIAFGDDGFGFFVEHDDSLRDGEDRGQFVGDDDEGRAQGAVQAQDEGVEFGGTDRVQACRGLVQKKDLRIERQGPCDGCAFFHAPGKLFRQVVLEAFQPDLAQLEADQFLHGASLEL